MRYIFDHVDVVVSLVSVGRRSSSVSYYLISLHPSKVCPRCETNYCTTKAECMLLVSAVQGFCCFCSLPYTFRYVFVNAQIIAPAPRVCTLVLFHSVCYARTHFSSHRTRQNKLTYPAADEGQKICGIFSETALFKSYGVKKPTS